MKKISTAISKAIAHLNKASLIIESMDRKKIKKSIKKPEKIKKTTNTKRKYTKNKKG